MVRAAAQKHFPSFLRKSTVMSEDAKEDFAGAAESSCPVLLQKTHPSAGPALPPALDVIISHEYNSWPTLRAWH